MGGVKVKFQPNVNNENFQRLRYCAAQLETIHFDGDDFPLIFGNKNIALSEWALEKYPSEVVKGKVLEILYYVNKALEVDNLNDTLNSFTLDQRWQLRRIAEKVLNILDNLELKNEYIKFQEFKINHLKAYINECLFEDIIPIENINSKIKHDDYSTFETGRNRLWSDIGKVSDFLRGGRVEKTEE